MPNKRGGESKKNEHALEFPRNYNKREVKRDENLRQILTVIFHKTYRKICLAPAKKRN